MEKNEDDSQLLRRYVEDNSQAAFAHLVQRHFGCVYSTALRRVNGDAHLAQDVTQLAFISLEKKARSLLQRGALAGWLHTATCYAAAQLIRTERRRRERELLAESLNPTTCDSGGSSNELIYSSLDEALLNLKHLDRELVLMRFFQNRTFLEIGVHFAIHENSARMRVERALDKLNAFLSTRKAVIGAGGVAALLAAESALASGLASHQTILPQILQSIPPTSRGLLATLSTMKTKLAVLVVIVGSVLGVKKMQSSFLPARVSSLPSSNTMFATIQISEPAATRGTDPTGSSNTGVAHVQAVKGSVPASALKRFRELFKDPAFRAKIAAESKARLGLIYSPLFRELNLTPVLIDDFCSLLIEKQIERTEAGNTARDYKINLRTDEGEFLALVAQNQEATNAQIKAFLGDSSYAAYQRYEETLPEHFIANLLQSRLAGSSSPLSDAATQQIALTLSLGANPRPDSAMGLSAEVAAGYFSFHRTSLAAASIKAAKALLSPAQASILHQIIADPSLGVTQSVQ